MAKRLELNGLEMYLLPQRVIYIPKYFMLIISDWHLGKLAHFRKEGLFVPAPNIDEELERMNLLIQDLDIKEIVFLGDLFHSEWNSDWEKLKSHINSFSKHSIQFTLTKGNHDILKEKHFQDMNMKIKDEVLLAEGVILSHEPIIGLPDYMFNIVGHIHPGCLIDAGARQSFRLPCFFIQDKVLTMPAFGKYTGLHVIKKDRNNKIFVIVNDSVLKL